MLNSAIVPGPVHHEIPFKIFKENVREQMLF